jgi:hypothetical protein
MPARRLWPTIACLLALAGCGGSDDADDGAPAGAAPPETTAQPQPRPGVAAGDDIDPIEAGRRQRKTVRRVERLKIRVAEILRKAERRRVVERAHSLARDLEKAEREVRQDPPRADTVLPPLERRARALLGAA